jgi:glucose-1-phosphate cytidylyltransferase
MKAVILAGGLGTRLSEETSVRPKPMVEIGGFPILWHIMKTYSHHGVNDFIICLGYKGYFIKEYFSNYFLHMSDVTYDMKSNEMKVHKERAEPWKVTLVDTGDNTMTGGRIKKVYEYLKDEEFFCLTYGDGVSDINIKESINYAKNANKHAMLTAAYPPGRFGALEISNGEVIDFNEKPQGDGAKINGGFFVLKPQIFDYIKDDTTIWENEPLVNLAKDRELACYAHNGFWQPMDTLRDKIYLEELWSSDNAPWKIW